MKGFKSQGGSKQTQVKVNFQYMMTLDDLFSIIFLGTVQIIIKCAGLIFPCFFIFWVILFC